MRRLLSLVFAFAVGAGMTHAADRLLTPQSQRLVARHAAAAEIARGASSSVAASIEGWPALFVGRLKNAAGQPRPTEDVLAPARLQSREDQNVARDLERLRVAASSADTDPDAYLDQLDSVVERAVLIEWQLTLAATDISIQIIQTEYDEAVARARAQFAAPSQAAAYSAAEEQARNDASAAYEPVSTWLAAARTKAKLTWERWAAQSRRDGTTRRMAAAIDTNLNVTPGCAGANQTALDRFLCAHEIVFGGWPAGGDVPRLALASAIDAYDIEVEPEPAEKTAGYFFRVAERRHVVAGYDALHAPIWPPERYPWARDLPPQLAAAIEKGSRILLFYGSDLVPEDGSELQLQSTDPRIVYQLLATARATAPEELVKPVEWHGFMRPGWIRGPWSNLTSAIVPFDAKEEVREAMQHQDFVMVFARLLAGTLPGEKTLKIGDAVATWILPSGTVQADVQFVRERVAGDFDALTNGFLNELVHVQVRLDSDVPLTSIPVRITADARAQRETHEAAVEVSRTLVATRDAAEPRLYVTRPFRIEWFPDYLRAKSAGVIPGYVGDGLAAGTDTHEVNLRSPGRLTILRDPDGVVDGWTHAIRDVSALRRKPVGSDLPALRAFLRDTSEILKPRILPEYTLPKTVLDFAKTKEVTVPILMGHHAALLVLRDELIRELKDVASQMALMDEALRRNDINTRAQLRMLEAELRNPSSPWQVVPVKGPVDTQSLPTPQNLELSRLGEFWSAARGEVPLARIIDDEYVARHFEYWEGQRWRLKAAQEGVAYFRQALQGAIRHAQLIKDDNLDGLLGLVRYGFAPIVARVLPDVLVANPPNSPTPWRADPDGRQYVTSVLELAERYAVGKAAGQLERSIGFVALTLATFVVAPEALAFRVAQAAATTLGAADFAFFTIPDYLNRRAEVAFATGASPVLGIDRLRLAELEEIPTWSLLIDAALIGFGGRADLKALTGELRLAREQARVAEIFARIKKGEIESFVSMAFDDRVRVTAAVGDALDATRRGTKLTISQRAALEFIKESRARQEEIITAARRAVDYAPAWHASRSAGPGVDAVAADLRIPPGYPPRVRGATPFTVRAFDRDGRPISYEVGNLIGAGTGSYVYECANAPGVALKFPHPNAPVAEWLDEAKRVDTLLTTNGIRHLPIVAIAENEPVPFIAQVLLPEGARRFKLQPGIVGYRVLVPGTKVPVRASQEELIQLAQKGLIALDQGYSLAGGGTLPRPQQRALLRLFKRIGQAGIIAQDLHLENLYFVRRGLTWEAGILDLESAAPFKGLLDFDQVLAESVNNIELMFERTTDALLPSMAGRHYLDDWQTLQQLGAERLYPDADFFMEKMLEHRWYMRYLPGEQRWIGSIVDLDIVEEFYPNFRKHVSPNMVDLADERLSRGIPGPRVPVDIEPITPKPWPEMSGPRGPPDPPKPPSGPDSPLDPDAPTPPPVRPLPPLPPSKSPGPPPPAVPPSAGAKPDRSIGIPEGVIRQRGPDEPRDLIYGIYQKDPVPLVYWGRARGAEAMDDIDKFVMAPARQKVEDRRDYIFSDMEYTGARTGSVAGLIVAIEEHRLVHFDLNRIIDEAAFTPGHPQYEKVTSYELRFIRDNWDRFNPEVKFYRGLAVADPPWKRLPSKPVAAPRPPPGAGRGGAPTKTPLGLTPEPPSDRSPVDEVFTPAADRERQRLQALAAERERRARLPTDGPGSQQAQASAPKFDVSAIPPTKRPTPTGLNDGKAPVRHLVEGDTGYVAAIMAGTAHHPSQTFVDVELVNQYVERILAGGSFPSGAGGLKIQIDAQNVIQEGQQRYLAAQIVRRLTGRPLFGGPNAIIPSDQIAFGAVVKNPRPPLAWGQIEVRRTGK